MPLQSMVEMAAREEAEHAARMATNWALVMQSNDPQSVATGLVWFGRHLSETFLRFALAAAVDQLGEQLTNPSAAEDTIQ
jgi:hypothetical protein